MASVNQRETLAELLGVSGGTIRWSHGLAFFIALLASDLITTLVEPVFRGNGVVTELPLSYWVGLPPYNLAISACSLVAFRCQRRATVAALLAAVGYAATMVPVNFLLQWLTPNPFAARYSPLVASWNSFSWAFLFLLGLVLALRWLRSTWLALGVGAAVGGGVEHVARTAAWALTRPDRSTPFSISFGSELANVLSILLAAALFAFLMWLGWEIARTPQDRMSKAFFLGSLGGANLLALASMLVILARVSVSAVFVLLALNVLLVLYTAVVGLMLLHKMWAAIQDGHARTTPGKAVGLLFVPVFNFYWIFQVFWGFARDYNRYVDRHGLRIRKLPAWLFLVLPITALFGMIPAEVFPPLFVGLTLTNMVAALVLIAKICDAVNALPESMAAVTSAPGVALPGAAA